MENLFKKHPILTLFASGLAILFENHEAWGHNRISWTMKTTLVKGTHCWLKLYEIDAILGWLPLSKKWACKQRSTAGHKSKRSSVEQWHELAVQVNELSRSRVNSKQFLTNIKHLLFLLLPTIGNLSPFPQHVPGSQTQHMSKHTEDQSNPSGSFSGAFLSRICAFV